MSADSDNPLTRWSRRKQAARSGERHPHPQAGERPAPPPAADMETDASLLPAEHDVQEPPVAGIQEPLPDLEELTAESDLAAFLKKGVPPALKRAALRKMWSLDPGIRDFVGPSEYAWDFNKPGSMAGFGPLDPERAVVDFLSKTTRVLDEVADKEATTPQAALPSGQPPTADPATRAEDEDREPPAEAGRSEPNPLTDTPETVHSSQADRSNMEDSPQEVTDTRLTEVVVRPRHGGAMPH